MARPDSWQERYLAVVPEKLTAVDAKVLLQLIEEDPKRFMEALDEFAAASDGCAGDHGRHALWLSVGCDVADFKTRINALLSTARPAAQLHQAATRHAMYY
jgi:uncharacterized protein (DUF1778 family)